MISPKKITFNNKSNEDFDLICDLCFEGGDSGEISSFLSRKAVTTETYNGAFRRSYGMKYDEVFAPQFTLMKRDFEDFTFEEQRAVLAWLTSKHTASYMDVYMTDNDVATDSPTYCLLGGVAEIETYKLGNNRTVGVVFTFESLYPYALSPLQVINPDIVNGTSTYILTCESDEMEAMVYPKITITQDTSLEISTGSEGEPSSLDLIKNAIYQNNSNENYFIWGNIPLKIEKYLTSDGLPALNSDSAGKYYYLTDKKEIVLCDVDENGNYFWNTIAEHVGGATRISIIYNIPEVSEKPMPYDMDYNTIYKDITNNKYYFKHNNSVEELNIVDTLPSAKELKELIINKFYYSKTGRTICKGIKYTGIFTKKDFYVWSPIAFNVKLNPSTDIIILNNSPSENIVIDGANKIISTSSSRIVGDDFSWNWLALRQGENTIEVTGNCEISFEWRDPIKIGQF